MGSEIEIPETPNWLKELEAKRERRLRTKLGHEHGAGAPCLTCEEKCPGLDLHFWRKICKNCKCSKENHEVQDDDIFGWAQDELLGTKVNRLKKKIVLPGRREEVELEWTPNGKKETIEKYLKSVPTELLPIKGSQAAQDRKQLLKKQIPIHDIDPTLCHELTEEELKKMQEYVSRIKQSSVGVGHLIQINFEKSLTHVLDQNEAMFLINNVPKTSINSENVVLQESNNAISLKNLTNALGSFNMRNKRSSEVQEPNMIIIPQIDDQNPSFRNIRDNRYNINDLLTRHDRNTLSYSPPNHRISTEDIQQPNEVNSKNLSYPEKRYENVLPFILSVDQDMKLGEIEKIRNMQYLNHNEYGNSNVKNLVPSAFVAIKHPKKNYTIGEVSGVKNLDNSRTKELPYPSQFISEQLKSRQNLCNYKPEISNISSEYQNPSFFEPIRDLIYPISGNEDHSLQVQLKNNHPETNNSLGIKNSGPKYPKQVVEYSRNKSDTFPYPQKSAGSDNTEDGKLKGRNEESWQTTGKVDQPSSLPQLKAGKINSNDVKQQLFKLNSIKDLAYSTYDSPPVEIQDGDHNLIVKDRLNSIKKEQVPVLKPSDAPITDMNLSPNTFFTREQREKANTPQTSGLLSLDINQSYDESQIQEMSRKTSNLSDISPQNSLTKTILPQSLFSQSTESDDILTHGPSWNRAADSSQTSRTFLQEDHLGREMSSVERLPDSPSTKYSNLSVFSTGGKNLQEEYLHPTIIPVGGIRDVDYTDPEIRIALSEDNDLFEGSVPSKFLTNLCMSDLPYCHYCNEKFKQDELAIAIPERSNAIFHTDCFKCQGCNQILADMFYFYDKDTDNIYCGRDFAKIRGIPRCRACDELIFVKEYCLAENSTFHVKHFCCFECDKPLAGQNYVMENDQPVCVPCYEITKANRCYACKDVIHPDQQGLQLKDGIHFHATEQCFACKTCKKPLFGAKLLFRKDYLFCSHNCYSLDI